MNKNDFKKIIEFAINNEVEAFEFYKNAADKVDNDSLKGIFDELSKEELEHKNFLENVLEKEITDLHFDEQTDYKIAESLDKPKLSVEMKFSDAIALAIKNEEEAMIMYRGLADTCVDAELKKLFLGLEEMELGHKTKLEEIYLDVAYAEVW